MFPLIAIIEHERAVKQLLIDTYLALQKYYFKQNLVQDQYKNETASSAEVGQKPMALHLTKLVANSHTKTCLCSFPKHHGSSSDVSQGQSNTTNLTVYNSQPTQTFGYYNHTHTHTRYTTMKHCHNHTHNSSAL